MIDFRDITQQGQQENIKKIHEKSLIFNMAAILDLVVGHGMVEGLKFLKDYKSSFHTVPAALSPFNQMPENGQ